MFAFASAPIDTPGLSPPQPLSHPCSLFDSYIGDNGASALAAVLKETQITILKCASASECSFLSQRPLTSLSTHLCSRARSLNNTGLGPEGGAALAEGLKGNSTLRFLE